ncbi:MAG: M20-dimer domain-containing protein [Burkholderia sp.]|jgi:glutamate carboxypeptidase
MTMLNDYLKDLAELVNRDCGTANHEGVTAAAAVMKRHFESIGWECEFKDFGDKSGKGLICRNKPGSTSCDLIMNAHLDTVFADGTAKERPFSIDGDRAHGPGCSDCKSGCLAIFYACKNARPEDLERLSIWAVFNPDEEVGSIASHEWLEELAGHAKAAMVFEAARANGELVSARKGVGNYRVTFHGVTAHAGNNPFDGKNANVAAMRFALEAYKLTVKDRGLTVNPGIIEGGRAVNVISDSCKILLDTRYWTTEEGLELEKQIRALAEKEWVEGVTCEFERLSFLPAMPFSERTRALIAKVDDAAREVGFEAKWVKSGGGSDGNHFALKGIPVIDGCGPAGAGFHTEREYLRLDTVEERIKMVVALLKRL